MGILAQQEHGSPGPMIPKFGSLRWRVMEAAARLPPPFTARQIADAMCVAEHGVDPKTLCMSQVASAMQSLRRSRYITQVCGNGRRSCYAIIEDTKPAPEPVQRLRALMELARVCEADLEVNLDSDIPYKIMIHRKRKYCRTMQDAATWLVKHSVMGY